VTRVLLADDSVLFREALAELLQRNGFDVVGQVGDADAVSAAVAGHRPDLAVLDIRMPPEHRLDGLRAGVRIRREHPGVGVLLLSQHLEAEHLVELVGEHAAGVGYLLKERASSTSFIDAVRRVATGGCAFDPEVIGRMVRPPRRDDPLEALSPREREVLALMAEGRSNPAIAGHLGLTAKTVETHVRNIFQRLGLPAQAHLDRRVLAVLAHLGAQGTP
jgi:DNA-binding NarL/FixJ family response regulator